MFCSNCGKEIAEGNQFCGNCGAKIGNLAGINNSEPVRHDIPKCTCCGYVGEWKLDVIFRWFDVIIGVVFMYPFFFPGISYLVVVYLIRQDKKNRNKICPKCNAQNLWTFYY